MSVLHGLIARPAKLRRAVATVLRQHAWLAPAATVICGGTLLLFALRHTIPYSTLAVAAGLFVTSYVWGYWTRASRPSRWATTSHLQRRQYAEVWDTLAASPTAAAFAVSGKEDEDNLRRSAEPVIRNLMDLVQIGEQDDVLEIGCGIGRIGRELAPLCRSWTGSDVSERMVTLGSERLRGIRNARFRQLQGDGLPEFADDSFDVVYFANMLSHLDELDRWRYVKDSFRVLRPGGRIYVDTVDVESDRGWSMFTADPTPDLDSVRPPYTPRFSTGAELRNYGNRAGFDAVQLHRQPPLVIMTAIKSKARA